jgi:hypothetical protein
MTSSNRLAPMRSAPRCGHIEKDSHERNDEPMKLTKGVTIQVYRPTGRPQYATATAD